MADDTRHIIASDELAAETEVALSVNGMDYQRVLIQSTASSLGASTEAELNRRRNESRVCCRRSFISIGILTFINLLNYMDRFSVAGLVLLYF